MPSEELHATFLATFHPRTEMRRIRHRLGEPATSRRRRRHPRRPHRAPGVLIPGALSWAHSASTTRHSHDRPVRGNARRPRGPPAWNGVDRLLLHQVGSPTSGPPTWRGRTGAARRAPNSAHGVGIQGWRLAIESVGAASLGIIAVSAPRSIRSTDDVEPKVAQPPVVTSIDVEDTPTEISWASVMTSGPCGAASGADRLRRLLGPRNRKQVGDHERHCDRDHDLRRHRHTVGTQ